VEVGKIVGAGMKMCNERGSGFLEPVCQESLEVEALKRLSGTKEAQIVNHIRATGPRVGVVAEPWEFKET
jgi:hypothetical protein